MDAPKDAQNVANIDQTQYKLDNVKLESGMLVFNTRTDFDSAIQVVKRGQYNVSDWLYKQFPNFNSQVKAFKALSKEDTISILQNSSTPTQFASFARKDRNQGEDFVARVIETNILGNLINKDGFIGYGDKIYKVTFDKVYEINKDDYLKNPNQDFLQSNTSVVKSFPVTHNKLYLKEKNEVAPRTSGYLASFSDYTLTFRGRFDKRWDGVAYQSAWYNWGNFLEVTTRYEGQLGGWSWWGGSWSTDQAYQMSVTAYYTVTITSTNNTGFPHNPYIIQTTTFSRYIPTQTQYYSGVVSADDYFAILDNTTNIDIHGTSSHYCYDYEGLSHYKTLSF